jgi:5-methylthioribose kinase
MQLRYDLHPSELTVFLQDLGWLAPNESIRHFHKPGEGNMNMVLRVCTDTRSFIIKQANPYVQKYPSIPASTERIAVEASFYKATSILMHLSGFLPRFMGFSSEWNLLAVEDLGMSADYTFIYQRGQTMSEAEAEQAALFLSRLHHTTFDATVISRFPENMDLRRLNHEHLVQYPYRNDTGFDLDTVQPGLQAVAQNIRADHALLEQVQTLGERYLDGGNTLLHGDYYPGSWLKTESGFRVIDPEFCFFGPAEYDFGIMMAHLKMAQIPESIQNMMRSAYNPPAGFDMNLANKFAGLEILRRIIGLAQLPLELTLEERISLLKVATGLVKN